LIVNGHARRAVASVVPQSLWPAAVTAGANPDWVDVPLVRLEPNARNLRDVTDRARAVMLPVRLPGMRRSSR